MTNQDDWYVKINPEMSVPAVKYNQEILTDTSKIVKHLIEKHPENELMPSNAVDRVKVESYVGDIFSKFIHINAFTQGHMSKQSLFTLFNDTIPTNVKLEKMREDPEMRKVAEAQIQKLEKDKYFQNAISVEDAEKKLIEIMDQVDKDL